MRITSLIIYFLALATLVNCASSPAPKIGAEYNVSMGQQGGNFSGTLVAIDRNWLVLDTAQRSESGDPVRAWISRGAVDDVFPIPSPAPAARPLKAATQAQLTEPPRLRFLGWQNENSDTLYWKNRKAWHADGSSVTTQPESVLFASWLHPTRTALEQYNVMNNPQDAENNRRLYLWFSQSNIATGEANPDQVVSAPDRPARQTNLYEVTLLDAGGRAITQSSLPDFVTTGPFPWEGENVGWLMATLSLARDTNIPPVVTMHLRYTFSAWEHESRFGLHDQPASTWDNGVQFNGIGLDKGNPALFIAVDEKQFSNLYFDVAALSSDGQAIALPFDTAIAGGGEGPTFIRYTFAASPNIARFRFRSKQIRTAEFKDVVIRNAHQP